jgi:hypothetical protein
MATYIARYPGINRYTPLIVDFSMVADRAVAVTDADTTPSGQPALLAATPSAEQVTRWLRTLALLAGVLGLLVGLFVIELAGRL